MSKMSALHARVSETDAGFPDDVDWDAPAVEMELMAAELNAYLDSLPPVTEEARDEYAVRAAGFSAPIGSTVFG